MQTGAAASWETHPLDFYVDYGLRVTINTDNRLITDTTVSKELRLCHKHYGWSLQTIKEIIIAGFKSAFMPYREKADLRRRDQPRAVDVRGSARRVTGRVGLVESEPPTSTSPVPPPPKAKLQVS